MTEAEDRKRKIQGIRAAREERERDKEMKRRSAEATPMLTNRIALSDAGRQVDRLARELDTLRTAWASFAPLDVVAHVSFARKLRRLELAIDRLLEAIEATD